MKKIKRARRAGLAAGVAGLAMMAFGSSNAQAQVPIDATFDDAALKIGVLPAFDVLEPPNVSTLDVSLNPGTGDFTTTAPTDFVFPDFSGQPITGVTVEVELEAAVNITGNAPGGGVVNGNASNFNVHVTGLGSDCNYTGPLQFTTGDGVTIPGGTPTFPGDEFTTTPNDPMNPLLGASLSQGAVQTSWPAANFPPDNSMACTGPGNDQQTINGLVTGTGALALANGIDLTPVPPPAVDPPAGSGLVPKTDTGNNKQKTKKKCKKKKGKKGASSAAKGKNCGKKKKK